MDKKYQILIMGKQGSGKGTQAEFIAKEYDLINISTGAMFREAIASESELGKKVKEIINQGKLVSDDLTNALVKDRLQADDCKKGFILDGFPRNIKQAEFIINNFVITHVLYIDISDKEAIKRIAGRLVCKCGATYHKEFNPPKKSEICDVCGERIEIRTDDKPDAVKKRLEIYHKQTKPVLDFFKKKDIYFSINGEQKISKVKKDIFSILNLK